MSLSFEIQAINAAFERLKRILPEFIQEKSTPASSSSSSSKADLTKIATLRTATDYIKLLCKLRDREGGLSLVSEEQIVEDPVHSTSELSCDKPPKDDPRMDTLPDISFISSDELSSLSFTSDEENQLSKCDNQTFDLMPACANGCAAQNETFLVKSNDSSSFVNKTITYVNPPVVGDQQASGRVNSVSHLMNSHQFNQTSMTIVGNQTYPVPSPALSNLNIVHSQQSNSQFAGSERFYTLQSTHLDSDHKLTNDLLDSNNNQYFNQASKSRNLIASTPLVDKSNDHHLPSVFNPNHQLQSTLFSPIKGDDHQAANHLSFKSTLLNEDSLLNCLEDIENADGNFLYTTTLTSSDDFDLIL